VSSAAGEVGQDVEQAPPAASTRAPVRPGGEWATAALAALVVAAVALRPLLVGLLDDPQLASWSTLFVAVTVQALPFLVLGVAVSGAIAAFVPDGAVRRVLPRRPLLAVPAAAAAGMVLPGCECGSVPIARRLVDRGVTPAAALAFLLSAPAINPVVLVATAVAFPGRPSMVAARLVAGLVASVVVGLVWTGLGRRVPLRGRRLVAVPGARRWHTFTESAEHDLLSAGGFLVIGAAAAATLQTFVPRSVLDAFAGSGWLSVLALGVLAVLLAVCSEADAFIAASLRQFSPTAQLAFMVVGPMVDVKLVALQAGTFGRRFALVFAPLAFGSALLAATLVGWWLL
jgi:uncharacterized membrane protein YraQ (UPF0718 family)